MTPEKKRWLLIGGIGAAGCLALVAVVLLAAGIFVFSRTHGSKTSGDCPTEAEVRATIQREFHELYFKDYGFARVADVKIDIGDIQFGGMTKHEVEYGKDAQPVCPVRAIVHVHVSYSNNETVRDLTRGEASDEAFLFYRNGFNEWTFKTGSP